MDHRLRLYAAAAGTAGVFLVVQLGALALVNPFVTAGYQPVEDPSDPTNSVIYLIAILVATAIILAVIRLGATRVLRLLVVAVAGMLSVYVFSVLVPPLVVFHGVNVVVWVFAIGLAIALLVYPEWYVIDATGMIIGAGGAGLFGISFGPLPAIILLGALALYDALSVYRTEHMLTLAESVTDLKLPLVLVIPLSLSYSFLDDTSLPTDDTSGEGAVEREAFFIGLGDTVMPTIMVASAAVFSSAPMLAIPGIAVNGPALAAMLGTFAGLAILLWLVAKGRPHAGLPLLNGGAIGGYIIGALAAGIPLVEAVGLAPYL